MKKLNKLCAILFAVLGVTTLKAQTDVTSTYLTNAGFDDESGWKTSNVGVTSGGNMQDIPGWTKKTVGWSSAATFGYGGGGQVNGSSVPSTGPDGASNGGAFGFSGSWDADIVYTQAVILPAGVYTLSYKVFNAQTSTDGNNKLKTNKFGFVASSGKTFYGATTTFTKSQWTEANTSFVLTTETSGNISIGAAFPGASSTVTPRLIVDGVTLTYKPFTDVTETNPVDLTSMISNTKAAWTGATETPSYDGITMVAVYKGSDWTGDALSQTINGLPAGKYEMEVYCQAHSSWDTDAAAEGATGYTYLKANEYSLDVPIRNADGATTKQLYTFEDMTITSGSLTISVVNEQLAANWISVYVKSLTYIGPDKSLEEANFTTNIAALNALSTNDVPTAFATKINDLKSAYGSADASTMTLNELMTANGDIKAVVDLHPSMVAAYANLNVYEAIYNNSEEIEAGAKALYKTALDQAKADATNAVTVDAINNVISELEVARQTYVVKADPTNDTYFDYTFLMTNPAVANGNGWTGARTNSGEQYTGAPDNTYWDSWNGAGQNIYQELTGLPSGLYTLKAAGRASTSCTSAYIYLNDTKVEIEKLGSTGNDLGNGWKWYTTEKTAVAGTAKVGFGCNTASSQWAGADDFHLYYYGFDVATAQTGVATLKAEAEALVGKPMNAEIASALNEAIASADATKTTRLELQPMIDALSTAVSDANASIAEYEKIAGYIAKANTIDESIAADVQTQYDNGALDKAEPVFQALEVATYNYVTENFNYNVALSSDWNKEGPVGELSDQHWSGEKRPYMEQSSAAWGWDAWSISYDQDLTLPAGKYVFKVAGRKAAGNGCTLELIVTKGGETLGTVNDFPEGDQGYGIDTSGAANFSEEGIYANDDKGRGWQWRYVKFTLANEATVNIAVNAEATTNHQWISFCDATVQMTEETYLEANKGGLDAPTAAAEALVDTKPMGTAENQALKDALALPVTTGAELLAKIDALNAAVANANTWIANYNTAKAPLVAALERFETDYNDAENGALDHMCKSRWTTAVDMAQAAAVAKDVTNSYEGFATATENLVAALDAATVSVDEYRNLKTAIDEANTIYGGDDWGSEPFQKPESVKDGLNTAKAEAQAAYDAAEVDGEGVTAVIESLNTTISDVVLNAPEEGQRFYIKVATEGHGKVGNAILATLGAITDNNPTGYGLNANNELKPYLNQAFIFTQVEGNLYNISIERPEGTVYLTYGSLNESAAGWNKQQIQATTDASKKGEFKIVPTGKNGILKIFNTVDNNYLDCQDGGSIYTDTGISNEEFAFELATEHSVTLNVSSAGWATLILPFNAEIPEGLKAYTSVALNNESVELVQVSEGGIKANTPYLIKGTGEYTFSGYGLAQKDSYEDENGLFVGTYVDYETTGGEYVLQNHDGKLGFYFVGESAKPTVKAYRCYLTAPTSEIKAFFFFDDDATGINDVDDADIEIEAIYTINGAKVNSLQKGLNIVKMSNGKVKKVFVK